VKQKRAKLEPGEDIAQRGFCNKNVIFQVSTEPAECSYKNRNLIFAKLMTSNSRTNTSLPVFWWWGILGLGLIAYIGSLNGPFIFDDRGGILNNPSIRSFFPTLGMFGSGADQTPYGRPIIEFSLAVNYAISGLQPWSYRLLNILLHLAVAGALFEFFRSALSACGWVRDQAVTISGIVVGLWFLHPLQTESVTYIVQRAEALVSLFYILTLLAALRAFAAETGSSTAIYWQKFAVGACALGMATKETMVTAPVAVLLSDLILQRSSLSAVLARWRFYLALAATWLVLAVLMFLFPRSQSVSFHLANIGPLQYFLIQSQAIITYLRLVFWPSGQSLDYWCTPPSLIQAAPYLALLTALFALAVVGAIRRAWWGWSLLLFFLVLAPTSTVVPIITSPMAEHRMYLPSAFILMTTFGGIWIGLNQLGLRKFVWPLAISCALALSVTTFERNLLYRSDIAMWTDVVGKHPENPRARLNLGTSRFRAGQLPEAKEEFHQALRLLPDFPEAQYNLGTALGKQGDIGGARAALAEAIRLRPSYVDAYVNLGNVEVLAGRRSEGMNAYRSALKYDPEQQDANFNLAVQLFEEGNYVAARDYARAARHHVGAQELLRAIESHTSASRSFWP